MKTDVTGQAYLEHVVNLVKYLHGRQIGCYLDSESEQPVAAGQAKVGRTSVSTHRKEPREMVTEVLGIPDTINDASSSESSKPPLPCTNDRLGRESRVSMDQDKDSFSASASISNTSTDIVKSQGEGPVTSSVRGAFSSFHERIRSNASDLFSPVESMLLRLIQHHGFVDGYKMFCNGFPSDVPDIQQVPEKLRSLADELEAAYTTNQT